MSNHPTMVRYHVKTHSSRANEIMQMFVATFPDSKRTGARDMLSGNDLHCYIYIADGLGTAEIIIRNTAMRTSKQHIELATWQDIATIPLMNTALAEAVRNGTV